MKKTALIVEDDDLMRTIMADFFKEEGFVVKEAPDGRIALDIMEEETVDLLILDIMIPELDGWTVCRRVRKNSDVPIIMLTARAEEDDKLLGYDLGADDYITKPFSLKVLVAKAKMLIKRAEGTIGKADGQIELMGIALDKWGKTVSVEGQVLILAPKEYEILAYLMENKNMVITREMILEKIWGYDYFGDLRTVDTHIRRIRAKLGHKAHVIATVIGSGYKFEVTKE